MTNPKGVTGVLQTVRQYLWLVVAVSAIVLTIIAALGRGEQTPNIQIGGAYTLTDHNGERVTERSFHGKLQVIYFGFTHCPDVCPTSVLLIGAALDQLNAAQRAQIQPILITLDPERDTPEAMKEYVDYFLPGMVGLTGTEEQIADVAADYRVGYWKVKDPNSALPYTIDHASIIFLMDRQGQFVRHFGQDVTADSLAEAIKAAL